MSNKVVFACVGALLAAGAAVPVLAGGGVSLPGSDGLQADSGLTAPVGFLRIASRDGRAAASQPQSYRFDTTLFSAIEPYALVKPWLGTERTAARNSFGIGGILVDVPLGNFVFTPSFGGGRYSESDGRSQTTALEFRSSLALGYRFEDQSRLSLDYSHTSTTAQTLGGPVGGNALSFTFRSPSSVLLGP